MYLGIDLGTSEVKAILLADSGEIVASAGAPLEVQRPQPRWSEQAPLAWWEAALAAVDRLKASHPAQLAAVSGLGLSGQMHGATLLDAADEPLRPAILWNDTRSDRRVQGARGARAGAARHHRQPGHARLHRAEAPLGGAARARRSSPSVRSVLLPKDYLRLRLTGEKVSEMSDAAGTLWLDVAQPRLVGRDAGRHAADAGAHAAAGGGEPALGRAAARSCADAGG